MKPFCLQPENPLMGPASTLPQQKEYWLNLPIDFCSLFMPHLLTSVHLLAIAVAVARIGVDADQGAAGVCLVARRNRQGWENWRGGGAGGGVRPFNLLLSPTSFFFFLPQSQTDDLLTQIPKRLQVPTCDGVEDLFGKGRVDRVAVAGDGRHSPAHAEVVTGALEEQEETECFGFFCFDGYLLSAKQFMMFVQSSLSIELQLMTLVAFKTCALFLLFFFLWPCVARVFTGYLILELVYLYPQSVS